MTFASETYGSYAYLKREVGGLLGYGHNEATYTHEQRGEVDAIVQRGVRAFYVPLPLPGSKYAHEWSFLCPVLSVATYAPYSTGTIAVSTGTVTLSGTGAAFPSWAAAGEMTISGTIYTVATRTSDTEIVLDDTSLTVAAGTSYTLTHPPIYDLDSDFVMLNGPLTYSRTDANLAGPIELVAEHQVRIKQQGVTSTGRPHLAAVRAREANAGYEIMFYPTPDAAYTIEYPSKINPAALSDANTMPYGGTGHLATILASCLAEAEAYRGETSVYSARYFMRLAASVSQDQKAMSPSTLGPDSKYPGSPWPRRTNESSRVTAYNGVTY